MRIRLNSPFLDFSLPGPKEECHPTWEYGEHYLSLHPFQAQLHGKKFILNPFFLWQLRISLQPQRPRHSSVPCLSGRCRAVALRVGGLLGRVQTRWKGGSTSQRVCWGRQWDFHPIRSCAWNSRFLRFLSFFFLFPPNLSFMQSIHRDRSWCFSLKIWITVQEHKALTSFWNLPLLSRKIQHFSATAEDLYELNGVAPLC